MDTFARRMYRVASITALVLIAWVMVWSFGVPDRNARTDDLFVVGEGATRSELSGALYQEGYIRSRMSFLAAGLLHGNDTVQPGAYDLNDVDSLSELFDAFETPEGHWLVLRSGMEKHDIARTVAEILDWDPSHERQFVTALSSMQWDSFNDRVIPMMQLYQDWDDTETKTFATVAGFFSDPQYDLFEDLYVPGEYLVMNDQSVAQVANALIERLEETHTDEFESYLHTTITRNPEKLSAIEELITGEVELLPDLALVPASDLTFERTGAGDFILFTTTYWNQGAGVLELRADPKTQGIPGDVERDVFQRIYRVDDEYREKLVGNFLWHQEHLHYHFSDFVDYVLEPVDVSGASPEELTVMQEKTTFCIRDIDIVNVGVDGAQSNPSYRVCGKERQGISVGWGDSYYYTYPDQRLDITGLPSGTYRLTYAVNPRGIFEESDMDNNVASVLLAFDMESGTVQLMDD